MKKENKGSEKGRSGWLGVVERGRLSPSKAGDHTAAQGDLELGLEQAGKGFTSGLSVLNHKILTSCIENSLILRAADI